MRPSHLSVAVTLPAYPPHTSRHPSLYFQPTVILLRSQLHFSILIFTSLSLQCYTSGNLKLECTTLCHPSDTSMTLLVTLHRRPSLPGTLLTMCPTSALQVNFHPHPHCTLIPSYTVVCTNCYTCIYFCTFVAVQAVPHPLVTLPAWHLPMYSADI